MGSWLEIILLTLVAILILTVIYSGITTKTVHFLKNNSPKSWGISFAALQFLINIFLIYNSEHTLGFPPISGAILYFVNFPTSLIIDNLVRSLNLEAEELSSWLVALGGCLQFFAIGFLTKNFFNKLYSINTKS